MDIFIIREGRQAGPYSEDAVKAFLTEGTARPADMGWCKGMAEWRSLGEVLKLRADEKKGSATQPPAASNGTNGTNGTQEVHVPATEKQKAFLKYLGAEFGENLTKQRAALAVSDALEAPKLQPRIRKWHDDKLRLHANIFQDEIDYRRANRTNRYLERIQTEGADVLKDVTKAHVQVLVESLDKKNAGWETEPEAALWDFLLPAIGSHFPQLVQPAHKGTLKAGGSRIVRAATRGMSATAGLVPPPRQTGTVGAMFRGVILGVIALGGILVGQHYWQKSRSQGEIAPAPSPEKKDAPSAPVAANEPKPNEPAPEPPGKLIAANKEPGGIPEKSELPGLPGLPVAPAQEPAPAPPVPADPPAPAPAMNAEKPAPPAPPALPAPADEKPAVPPPAVPPTPPDAPAPVTPSPASVPRTAVRLTQGIGVMLSNGQVALPAGTILRYLATEGANVRVSWNNNVFFVPAAATNVNEPVPAPSEPAALATPAAGMQPAAPPAPGLPAAPAALKPKKPTDDL